MANALPVLSSGFASCFSREFISWRCSSIVNLPPGGCEILRRVRLFVCLSVLSHNSKTTRPNFTKFLCMLPVAMALTALRHAYIFPVLWMTLCFHTVAVLRLMCIPKRQQNTPSVTALTGGPDSNQCLLNDKDRKYCSLNCAPGRSLLGPYIRLLCSSSWH